MKKTLILVAIAVAAFSSNGLACTNFLITGGASTDGSVMISYAADSHQLYGCLYSYTPKGKSGLPIRITEWDTGKYLGEIAPVHPTYSTVGNMNEHQVTIGETTFGGRELADSTGIMDYGSLIYITLQRARTAREAIDIFVNLANKYGYHSEGESISIGDPNEAWLLELIGKGCKIVDGRNINKGIVWVARRIPDGYICAHANYPRISTFPLNDPENTLYAPDVISFAREQGFFSGRDEDFSFKDVYAPLDFSSMRACEARVWSFFRRFNSDMDRYVDYAMGHNPSNPFPLWIKPDRPISPKEVFDAMRDHYEGTPMDMTVDVGAGGSRSPYRWRPMVWEVDSVKYVNERATATQQTGFWFVSQARKWLPDPVGGILWFGVDDTATSCLTPIYCSVTRTPECLREGNGSMLEYSPTSAFWFFNRVAQFAYLRYDYIGAEVRKVVDEWEKAMIAQTLTVDASAAKLKDPRKMLTEFSSSAAQRLFDRWTELDRYLMVKYIDGNIKKEDANGFLDNGSGRGIPAMPLQPGYSEKWKRAVVQDAGETLKVTGKLGH
ncbi:MAG: C69 family dipeptidase [Rikenellaceae bacterium]|jgi:dipeptidase|nr:C69 family dipeptidase [Rikenellaceae bacterium]